MKIDELQDDGSREKEVFATYGLAMYQAQILERGLINLLLLLELTPSQNTRRDYDVLAQTLDKRTAGALMKRLRKAINVDDATIRLLENALDTRNHLAHSFFYKNAAAFTTTKGKQQMLSFCDEARLQFIQADLVLSTLTDLLLELNGIDRAKIDAMEQHIQATWTEEA